MDLLKALILLHFLTSNDGFNCQRVSYIIAKPLVNYENLLEILVKLVQSAF